MRGRKWWILLAVGAAAVIVVVVLSLLLTGHLYLHTQRVELGPLQQTQPRVDGWLSSTFDGGVRNQPVSEARLGTGGVTLGFEYSASSEMLWLNVSVNHADATRLRNLRLRLKTPPGCGQLLFELPGGDGWNAIRHHVGLNELTLEFDRLGWSSDGYQGSVALRFACWLGADLVDQPGAKLNVEAAFDLSGTGLRRFTRWQVHGDFEVPITAQLLGLQPAAATSAR